jgi:hypothetical protein
MMRWGFKGIGPGTAAADKLRCAHIVRHSPTRNKTPKKIFLVKGEDSFSGLDRGGAIDSAGADFSGLVKEESCFGPQGESTGFVAKALSLSGLASLS